MKKRLQGFVAGILCCVLFAGISVFAKNSTETIQAVYSNIKIYVDGIKVEPKDANGSSVEPFIYNGTTYLPVRAVGEAIGKQVHWDGATKSVWIGEKPGDVNYFTSVLQAYEYDNYRYEECSLENGKGFNMSGEKYSNGIILDPYNGATTYGLYNLNGKYRKITFKAGHIDGSDNEPVNVKFYLDGKLVKDFVLNYDELPKEYTVNLNNALQLKIEAEQVNGRWNNSSQYGLADIIID